MKGQLLRNDPNFEGSICDLKYPPMYDHTYATQWAAALADALRTRALVGNRNGTLDVCFQGRLHQLMGWTPATVDDWQF